MIKFVSVGQTYKAHGVKGEIFAELNEGLEKYVFKAGVVFIKVDGCPVPFFIQSHRDEGRLFLKFEDVNDPEYARKISGTTIYLDEKSLPSNIRDKEHFKSALNELDGYTIVDENSKKESCFRAYHPPSDAAPNAQFLPIAAVAFGRIIRVAPQARRHCRSR